MIGWSIHLDLNELNRLANRNEIGSRAAPSWLAFPFNWQTFGFRVRTTPAMLTEHDSKPFAQGPQLNDQTRPEDMAGDIKGKQFQP